MVIENPSDINEKNDVRTAISEAIHHFWQVRPRPVFDNGMENDPRLRGKDTPLLANNMDGMTEPR
jgi:hypothetical protein